MTRQTSAPSPPPPSGRDRMSRDERRTHLLDVAARLVLAGELPLSMEGMARAAGVSKTLPYKHFDNITALLVELHRREARRVAQVIWTAIRDAGPDEDRVRVWIRAYFDALAAHGAVLERLHTPGSDLTALTDPDGRGAGAVALALREVLGVDERRAGEVSRMVHGAIVGAARSWVEGEASREDLEPLLVDLIRAVRPSAR